MSASQWKHFQIETTEVVPTIPFLSARTSFAVDASGSTAGLVMRVQEKLVRDLTVDYEPHHSVIMWGSGAELPVSVEDTRWASRNWGTYPEQLFDVPQVTEELKSCDAWYLLTDGEVFSPHAFANRAAQCGMTNTPVVFLIVNSKPSVPSGVNVSVGLPVFASAADAMIAFKDTQSENIHVLAAQGAFLPLVEGHQLSLSDWDTLPSFPDNASFKLALGKSSEIIQAVDRKVTSAVDLGPRWLERHRCAVKVDVLLQQLTTESVSEDELLDLLHEDTFEKLALVCKTRGILPALRDWLMARKVKASVIELRDVAEAGKILERLRAVQDPKSAEADALRAELRKAHTTNMVDYKSRTAASKVPPLLVPVNEALSAVTAIEKAGYGADILDRRSNRAMRAATVNAGDVSTVMANIDLGEQVHAHRATCEICCSDDSIMSLVLKASTAPANNTTDFALNMPLHVGASSHNADVLSSQYVCFQCAVALKELRGSIYQEDVVVVLPLVAPEGMNKAYINKALPLVFTGGLATGASGLSQLLMATLVTTMKDKVWAREQDESKAPVDAEIEERRKGMSWLLAELVKSTPCRETFDETGPWVLYPKALAWALKNFQDEGIYSWIVRYSIPGLTILFELVRVASMLQSGLALTLPEDLQVSKIMYEMVSLHMSKILAAGNDGAKKAAVQAEVLKLVYNEFNADNVPQDLEGDSILPASAFSARLLEWPSAPAFKFLVGRVGAALSPHVPALQYIAFTLAKEEQHQSPKGFFQRAAGADVHFHTAVSKPHDFDSASSKSAYLAIFAGEAQAVDHINLTATTIPPFVTPYGASTLHCGVGGCNVRFDVDGPDAEKIRKRRAAHMVEAFGIKGVEWKNVSGMPENTARLGRPTSMNVNMHAGICKSWSVQTEKQAILDGDEQATGRFVDDVVAHICVTSGRGNIYKASLRQSIRWTLPNFFVALQKGAEKMELGNAVDFVYEFQTNTLKGRIAWELTM